MKHRKLGKAAVAGLLSALFLILCGESKDVSTKSKERKMARSKVQSLKRKKKKPRSAPAPIR
ncbi:hypothetical protein [Cytobacillus firmus]|uniref:hypothetical protein n=1 Tax=Cytobacillus firmus TaxID=1399 RepID=UPI00222817BA|nr:hypothetical protein [Cytobacillus firmus]